jgi:hypothetical protein
MSFPRAKDLPYASSQSRAASPRSPPGCCPLGTSCADRNRHDFDIDSDREVDVDYQLVSLAGYQSPLKVALLVGEEPKHHRASRGDVVLTGAREATDFVCCPRGPGGLRGASRSPAHDPIHTRIQLDRALASVRLGTSHRSGIRASAGLRMTAVKGGRAWPGR